MLDEDAVTPPDRLRLLLLYILARDGILTADLSKLLAHASLPSTDEGIIHNMSLLGAHTQRALKDSRPPPPPLFQPKPPPPAMQEEYALSRYEPALQRLLEASISPSSTALSAETFPYTKPPLDMPTDTLAPAAPTSLRAAAAKPTWARGKSSANTAAAAENRQRTIVFLAGGATYSESRACYEIGARAGREVFLVTSHMLTPALFVQQVADLSKDKRFLNIPAEGPQPQAPAHLFEPDEKPKPPPTVQQPRAPVQSMGNMSLNGGAGRSASPAPMPAAGMMQGASGSVQANSSAKLQKEPEGKVKEKKKHRFFGKKDKS